MTVRELLSRMDSRELAEWVAYYSIEPFGNFRSDLNCGIVASTIANCNRSKTSKVFKPMDFMPIGKHNEPNVMDGDDIKAVMMSMAKEQEEQQWQQ